MRHLQQVYEKHREKGLVVLGIDCMDNPKIAREFLAECGTAFPSIIDRSPEARDLCNSRLQTLDGRGGFPLTYLIGRNGKIVAGWYGNRSQAWREKMLAKVGLR